MRIPPDSETIIIYWLGMPQKAHAPSSFAANDDVDDLVMTHFNQISKRVELIPFYSLQGKAHLGIPPNTNGSTATIPAVAKLIRFAMVGLIRLFPQWGGGQQWKALTKQEKLEKIVESYAPVVETIAKGITYWALRYVLMAAGVDHNFSSDVGILALVNLAFGLLHSKVYQRDPSTGELKLSETTPFSTRLLIAVKGMATDLPLLFSVFNSLLDPFSLILGNAAALGLAIILHRLNNSIAVGSLSARFGTIWNAVTTVVVSTGLAVVITPLVMANFVAPMGTFFFISLASQLLDPSTAQALTQKPILGVSILIFGGITNFMTYLFSLEAPAMLAVGMVGALVTAALGGQMPVLTSRFKKAFAMIVIATGLSMPPAPAVSQPVHLLDDTDARIAVRESLTIQLPVGSVLGEILSRYEMSAGNNTPIALDDANDLQRAIETLERRETHEKAIYQLATMIGAWAGDSPITLGMVGYGTSEMSPADQETALAILRGLLMANKRVVILANDASILEKLEVTDGEKGLIQVIEAYKGIPMTEVEKAHGGPLWPIVFASEGAVKVDRTNYQLTTYRTVADSVKAAIAYWIKVLQSA